MKQIKYVVYECKECGYEAPYKEADKPRDCPQCGARSSMKRV